MWLLSIRLRPRPVRIGTRVYRFAHVFPSMLPSYSPCRARRGRFFKFGVAVTVWFLSICSQKIRPARPHISRHMFHNDSDRIGFGIQRSEECRVRTLAHRALAELLVVAKKVDGIFQVGGRKLVCHSVILNRCRNLSIPVLYS